MSFVPDVSTISVVIASISVIVYTVYFIAENRRQRRIMQTDSIIRLSPWLNVDAKDIQDAISSVCSMKYTDYKDYLEKYDGKPEQKSLRLLGNYFEGVGLLVFMKLVDLDIVYNFWGDIAESVWDGNEEIIKGMRRDIGSQWTFQYWEFLVKEIKKRNALNKNK
jgi:hypothetical protein